MSVAPWEDRVLASDLAYRRLKPSFEAAGVALYQDSAPAQVPGTGGVFAVVIQASSGWGRDDWHKGVKHPGLILNIYSDDTRDQNGEAQRQDATAKAYAVYDFADALLDGSTSRDWPEVYSCRRDGEPTAIPVPDGLGAVLLHVRYELAHA